MSWTIVTNTKLRSVVVSGTHITLAAALQTALQALANGDTVLDISITSSNKNKGDLSAHISYELA